MARFSFSDTVRKLSDTPIGKEASMYGPLRDLFVHVLGYPAADVDIDTTGEGGRPDVTVRASAGFLDAKGRPVKVDWIVVEAKDEKGCFRNHGSREAIFENKAKYANANTAWFVMAEPTLWVIRPVVGGSLGSEADVEIDLLKSDEASFRTSCSSLLASNAGVSAQLERFREGDINMIAIEKLSTTESSPTKKVENRIRLNRRRFFQHIRESTIHLQSAVAIAYSRIEPDVQKFQDHANLFWEEFGHADDDFDPPSLTVRGRPQGPEAVKRHRRAAAQLKRTFAKSPHVARLALRGLPEFQARTGVPDDKLHELFAIETANLILARVLLLRFFEDHGFFGDTRYICNGGIAAFQQMRSYFHASYVKLLAIAYAEGSHLYASAFAETELDWVFGTGDETLSNAIEVTLFRFARFDFTTIKGDILTGIYDRFMDRDQRKKLGEFYTPPSIARYIIDRIGVTRHSRVFDPACGSGTFLIESYRAMVGDDVDRGVAEYSEVVDAMSNIAGNDLNTFSSVLAQIQLLWQILAFKTQIAANGFPDLLITAKVNSLVEVDQWGALDRFAEIDQPEYDAVVGNPPYVRAERSDQALDARSIAEFQRGRGTFTGISGKLNSYALFLYRALDRWCRPVDEQGRGGKVGFVLPVSFFDSNDTAQLRTLFAFGGRWTIREIVDLEVIYRSVFDADVLPAILIVENRTPRADDVVSIRYADPSCVHHHGTDALPTFDIAALPVSTVSYTDIFSPDGRILTRLTPERLRILRQLWSNSTFNDVAKPYWIRKVGAVIVEWSDQDPGIAPGWESRRMIAGGLAFRGKKEQVLDGIDVYKGENIIAASLQGEPALKNADITKADDMSLWKYRSILPARGLAVAQVAHTANGVMFDPAKAAFTNTTTVLLPRDSAAKVPFDLLLMSSVYVWFYALGARMGVLRTLRSHVYPTNLGILPWNDSLRGRSDEIEGMRAMIMSACSSRLAAEVALEQSLAALDFPTFKRRVTENPDARVTWGDNFLDPDYEVRIEKPTVAEKGDGWRITLSSDLFDWVECNQEEFANGLAIALQRHEGAELTRSDIFRLQIPAGAADANAWKKVISSHKEDVLISAMTAAISALDDIVGACLGLAKSDIAEIQRDLASDSFLARIRPRYPGTITRKQGFRTGLDSEARYD